MNRTRHGDASRHGSCPCTATARLDSRKGQGENTINQLAKGKASAIERVQLTNGDVKTESERERARGLAKPSHPAGEFVAVLAGQLKKPLAMLSRLCSSHLQAGSTEENTRHAIRRHNPTRLPCHGGLLIFCQTNSANRNAATGGRQDREAVERAHRLDAL